MGANDWRELLDDPAVEVIVRKVVRIEGGRVYRHPNDALLKDDLESYLWDASVRIAEKADIRPGDPSFYGWLYVGLRMATEHHRAKLNGEYGSHKQKAHSRPHISIDAEAQRVLETGYSPYLFSRQLTSDDPLAILLRLERLEEHVRILEAKHRTSGVYTTETTCSEPLCTRPAETAGMCPMHYARYRKHWLSGTCTIDGCTKGVTARGLCSAHYRQQWLENKDQWAAERQVVKSCTVKGCDRPFKGLGFCRLHLDRSRRAST